MATDDFQQAWQAPESHARVTIRADVLRSEVQRNQQDFNTMIWFRDVREIGVALVLIPVWFIMGAVIKLPWTWYLMVPSLLGVAAFMLLDRRRHPQAPSPPGAPLVESVEVSLRQVEHQIWLLRNIAWWYLLPFVVPMFIFFADVSWDAAVKTGEVWSGVGFLVFLVSIVSAMYGFICWVNQRAVRTVLEPRRQELRTLLASLKEDPSGESAAHLTNTSAMQGLRCMDGSPWRTFVAALGLALVLLAISLGIYFLGTLVD